MAAPNARAAEVEDTDQVILCAFAAGEMGLAIDSMRVRQIVRPLPVMPVPHAPPACMGVVDYQGVAIPVIDVHHAVGLPHSGTPPGCLLVVAVGEGLLALALSRPPHIVHAPRQALSGPPNLKAAAPKDAPATFLGTCAIDGRLYALLDVRALVPPLGAPKVP